MARTIAIGDIHGCSRALDALIGAIKPTPADTLVLLGDFVDRGPDSRGVLDRLVALDSRCRLVPILGNHDEMMIEALRGGDPGIWYACGGAAAIASYGTDHDLSVIPGRHVQFLESCLEYLETGTHIFLHANYDPDLPMDQQDPGMLRWESLKTHTPAPHDSGKRVITGHSSQKSGEILDLGHIVCIDTFCYGGGWLTALEVHTDQVWQADRTGRLREPNR